MEACDVNESKTSLPEAHMVVSSAETTLWDELEQLGDEIGANWQLDMRSIELISLLRGKEG